MDSGLMCCNQIKINGNCSLKYMDSKMTKGFLLFSRHILIAGLYTALQLQIKHPNAKICILESSNRIAGRIATVHKNNSVFEAGGARFNNNQTRILNLIK